jgi:uncharacterized membrane protein
MFNLFEKLPRVLDVRQIESAIAEAEKRTSGQIRVSLSPFFWGSTQRAAERAFVRLHMDRTANRNGVLIFVVPSRRSFVVLGDKGVHERVGDELWTQVVRDMTPFFRRREFTDGVLRGIALVGDALERHFLRDGNATTNELPDDVDTVAGHPE